MWILIFGLIGLGIFITLVIFPGNGSLLCLLTLLVVPLVLAFTSYPPDEPYNYKAFIYGKGEVYFKEYQQDANCIILPDYYTESRWDMRNYHHNEPLIIKIPEGKKFEFVKYRVVNTDYQHVVNDCSEP